jgi:hypothetical protein
MYSINAYGDRKFLSNGAFVDSKYDGLSIDAKERCSSAKTVIKTTLQGPNWRVSRSNFYGLLDGNGESLPTYLVCYGVFETFNYFLLVLNI